MTTGVIDSNHRKKNLSRYFQILLALGHRQQVHSLLIPLPPDPKTLKSRAKLPLCIRLSIVFMKPSRKFVHIVAYFVVSLLLWLLLTREIAATTFEKG